MTVYKGKIRIEGVGTAIDVSTSASSPSAAKKIIEYVSSEALGEADE